MESNDQIEALIQVVAKTKVFLSKVELTWEEAEEAAVCKNWLNGLQQNLFARLSEREANVVPA